MYVHSVLFCGALEGAKTSGVVRWRQRHALRQQGCPRWLRGRSPVRKSAEFWNMKEGVPVRAFGCYRSMYYANERIFTGCVLVLLTP